MLEISSRFIEDSVKSSDVVIFGVVTTQYFPTFELFLLQLVKYPLVYLNSVEKDRKDCMAFKVCDNWLFIYFADFASIIKSLAYLIELLQIDFGETFVEQTCDIGFPCTIIISDLWSFKHEIWEFIYE